MKTLLGACALVLALPLTASAQAALSGLVKDTSGAVLPGVTVEASSPVLIEKLRSAVTDSTGRYAIPDLRPGAYKLTFTLPGFKTVVRDGLELSGTGVTINADMTVGGVEETITVSGATPTVNLQSTTRQAVMDQEIVTAVPTARNPFAVGVLIPGVRKGAFTGQDVGGSVVQEVASLEANGGRTADQRMMVNGVALSSMIAGGWGGGAVPNATGTSEFAIDVSGVDAQAATGGVRINFIPRDGGNKMSGTIVGGFTRPSFVSDNYTGSDVQKAGLTAPGTVKANGDFNPGVGGPIQKDKLWFFLSGRALYADNLVAGTFLNQNVNQVNNYRWQPSTTQAIAHQEQRIYQARLTWQASPKNKIGVTFDQEKFCACTTGLGPATSPEAGNDRRFPLQRFVTSDWSNPVSSKLLLEASAIHRVERWGGMEPQEGKVGNISALTPGMTSVNDSSNPLTHAAITYRSAQNYNNSWNWNIHYRAAVSYITGSNSFKVGFNNAYGHHENTTYSAPQAAGVPGGGTEYSYSFREGVPGGINYGIYPRTVQVNVNNDMGLFAQDKWTTGRWTLSGGVRWDYYANSFPAQSIAPTFLAPNLKVSFPEIKNANWKDITPKMGATYDLFGNGKTALKITANKYLEGLGTTGAISDAPNPILSLVQGGSRSWTDNGDFIPQCNLQNYQANGECGALSTAATFGTVGTGAVYDPKMLNGWGKRGYNWEFTGAIQQQIIPRVSVEVQYARRLYGNFRVNDDLGVTAANYDTFTFTTPSDSRLPNGGGQTLHFVDPKPGSAPERIFVTLAKDLNLKQTEHFDGVNVTVQSRMQNGLLLQGGLGTGRVVTDDCEVVAQLPETLHQFFGGNQRGAGNWFFAGRSIEDCLQNNGWRSQLQGLAAYTIPKADVQISGTFQNLPGARVNANALLGGVLGAPTSLARPLTDGLLGGRIFNVTSAGDLYVERLNQLDFRTSKIFRMGNKRTHVNFDFYNVMNANSVLAENAAYGPTWRTPQTILVPRLFKLSAQFDF